MSRSPRQRCVRRDGAAGSRQPAVDKDAETIRLWIDSVAPREDNPFRGWRPAHDGIVKAIEATLLTL